MKISIREHRTISVFPKAYVIYIIDSCFKRFNNTNTQNYSEEEYSVERRYSDFVLLCKKLAIDYPGLILSCLPPKTSLYNIAQNAFIQDRKVQLQDFLNDLSKHPRLTSDTTLRSFLTIGDNWYGKLDIDNLNILEPRHSTDFDLLPDEAKITVSN